MGRNWRATGLAATMVALLLLAARGGALPTFQPREGATTAPQADFEPSGTALPSVAVEPTATAESAETLEPADTEEAAGSGSPTAESEAAGPEYEIVTLLPPDAIPAIDSPRFYGEPEADEEYHAQELVIGVEVDGEARAYPVALLSRHEIVNDTVGGHPIAVTW